MRAPRMTTRRWMLLVAVAAFCTFAVQALQAIGWDRHARKVDEFWINHPGVDQFHLDGSDDGPPPRPWWIYGP